MNRTKLLNSIFSLLIVASMLLMATSQVSAKTPTPPAPKPPAHIHQGKITQADRQAAAQRLAKAKAGAGGLSSQAIIGNTPDYFSFTPNYAISPIPPSISIIGDGVGATYIPVLTGNTVTGAALATPATLTDPGSVGSGYTLAATTITVIGGGKAVDGNGNTGCVGTPTISAGVAGPPAIQAGAITGITFSGTCSGFNMSNGIRKFVDVLPAPTVTSPLGGGLYVAHPDTTTYPGADYYEITLKEDTWQFSSSLPFPTKFRGYMQTNTGTDGMSPQAHPSYLGPVIVASENRPVRVKFINALPTGTGGNLFIPVDTTVMGAGMGPLGMAFGNYTQNRATLHLHGGATPWISDGTPHQWTTPAGETTSYPKGVSVQNVPDMLPLPSSPTQPSDGTLTFYYTNQQSARLMFYHDHAYGITRLNVYAGEAAGYVVQDDFESMMMNGTALDGVTTMLIGTGAVANATVVGGAVTSIAVTNSGANYTSDPAVTITDAANPTPAVVATAVATMSGGKITNITVTNGGSGYTATTMVNIDNTSFTAAAGTIPAQEVPLVFQDKTFVDTNDITRTDPTWAAIGMPPTTGSLWYPHVYMPNQNPTDMMGSNATGRWDWGPWFWPPWNVSKAALPNPYFGNGNIEENPVIPSTPNPSIVPEGYMDTPLVNGKAYPVMNLAPQAYRFRILNAANDRYMNLSLFCAASQAATPMWNADGSLADGNQGEVKMVPATPGSGLPALWPTDGRDGGVPDPAAAGPSWIVIGTEGGLLPQSAVVPPTPVGYEYNRRSITVLNVSNKSLYLGPAERADVIVDFSTVNMATCNRLIVYNDAPAPMPAFDPRNDYYTGDPDNTSTGGAPTTLPGYGPNTRTMMQINLSGTVAAFNKAALDLALPKAFAATQDAPVVPEPAFNNAMSYTAPTNNYVRIQDTTINFFNGPITKVNVTNGGTGYTLGTTSFTITGGGSANAGGLALLPVITPVVLTDLTLTNINSVMSGAGSGYTSVPTVNIVGTGSGATGTVTITKVVSKVSITNAGAYVCAAGKLPSVLFSGGGATTQALGTVVMNAAMTKVASVTITQAGAGYVTAPTVTFGVGTCATQTTQAKGTATLTGVVDTIKLTNPGSGYQSPPTVTITGGGAPLATAAKAGPVYVSNVITAISVTNPGANYVSAPTIVINGGTGATAVAAPTTIGLGAKAIQELFDNDYGRMNATLGVELPNTNGTTQTTIPYGYVDPATEILQLTDPASFIGQLGDGTQIWKITHNGVDSHPVHFHLFNVQLINRVGWDGMVKPPLPTEIGWKDTVIMNPLEDAIVAIRAVPLSLPWQLPNSVRALDPAMPLGSTTEFYGVDPANQPVTVVNAIVNYGWEYVWHCHILGHEENDFMRPMLFAIAPAAPTTLTLTALSSTSVNVKFTDASVNETGFVIQRAATANGPWTTVTTIAVAPTAPASKATGAVISYNNTGLKTKTTYFYRVMATNTVGSNVAGYPMSTATSLSTAPLSVITK